MSKQQVNYTDYLALDQLLNAQHRESAKHGRPSHDEMLFIITHQTYELWFKQVLFELADVLKIFNEGKVPERKILHIQKRLERIDEILRPLVQQVDIIETMTPLDFLDFRDDLVPASGFQSWQFRLLEAQLGMGGHQSAPPMGRLSSLKPEHLKLVKDAQQKPSLFDGIEKWLERTPFLTFEGYDFWSEYQEAVTTMLDNEEALVRNNLTNEEQVTELAKLAETRDGFDVIFDKNQHTQAQDDGNWRLSYKALQAALLIMLYRDEPMLTAPYEVLDLLIRLDKRISTWRTRHMQMAQRMIGQKMSTGGLSAGNSNYLLRTITGNQVFKDFAALSTFLIPRRLLPDLPEHVRAQLTYQSSSTTRKQA